MNIRQESGGEKQRLNLHIFLSTIENETRLFKEARFTMEHGIFTRVVVLGMWDKGLARRETTPYGLEIHRLKVLIREFGDRWPLNQALPLRRLAAALSMLQFCFLALLQAGRLRPSHVSCHNVMLLPIAWLVARLTFSRLVYVPHELETLRSGLGGALQKLQAGAESIFIHTATSVVVVCEPIANWYREKYGLTDIHIVRNLPERAAIGTKPVPEGGFRERFAIPSSATLFIYQGVFGKARGVDRLLDIFSGLDPHVSHLVLMGYGEDEDESEISRFVARCSNIHFQPAVPREWIVSYTSGADIGLWISEVAPLSYRYALPNKFFEYAHAGLPILVSDNLEHQADIIAREGIGWSAPFDEIEDRIMELSRTDLGAFRDRAREFARNAVWEADAEAYQTVYRS